MLIKKIVPFLFLTAIGTACAGNLSVIVMPGVHLSQYLQQVYGQNGANPEVTAGLSATSTDTTLWSGNTVPLSQLNDQHAIDSIVVRNLQKLNPLNGGGLFSFVTYEFDITGDSGAVYYQCRLIQPANNMMPSQNFQVQITGLQSKDCHLTGGY